MFKYLTLVYLSDSLSLLLPLSLSVSLAWNFEKCQMQKLFFNFFSILQYTSRNISIQLFLLFFMWKICREKERKKEWKQQYN